MRRTTTTPSKEPPYVTDPRHPEGADLWVIVCTIFEVLHSRQMTQEEFCRQSGVSLRTLKNWRKGTSKPSFHKLHPALLCLGYRLIPAPDTEKTRKLLNNQETRNYMASTEVVALMGT